MTQASENMPETEAAPARDGRMARGDRTRQTLIDTAFTEMHEQGFRAASLNGIIRKAGCTKGSLYHHFPDKHALGLAAVSEHMAAHILGNWTVPLAEAGDPLTSIRAIIERYASGAHGMDPRLGCPFQNLTQEMAGLDEEFRACFTEIFERWRGTIADALARGQQNGTVRKDIDPKAAATLIVASHQGVVSMMKATQDLSVGESAAIAFFDYLESLRP